MIPSFFILKRGDIYWVKKKIKEINTAGWIFADYHNKLDGTDRNIIIYGHNMRNNTMFGTLKNVLNEEWKDVSKNIYDLEGNVLIWTTDAYDTCNRVLRGGNYFYDTPQQVVVTSVVIRPFLTLALALWFNFA